MKINHLLKIVTFAVLLATTVSAVQAADLVIQDQTIIDTQSFDSPEATIFTNVVLAPTANVHATSTYEVILRPGTRIQLGATFVATMRDADGMPNRCEMTYFGDLTHEPGDDDDGDGLLNIQECLLGYNPNESNPDNDADGLPDAWEVQYAGLNLATLDGPNGDADNDGISNWIEYTLGTDPTAANNKGPGIYYQYDELGRILKIERIPSR
jgi:hypothetical protein